jgi:tRNA pseudouridine38-40 synthase
MRYFIEVCYDGTHFHGSQLQGATPTVQLALDNALSTLLRAPVQTFGASRTDTDVHALSNYYHFDHNEALSNKFIYQLNAILSAALSVKHIYIARNPELNARFDAQSRSYRYRIYQKKDPFLHRRALFYPFKIDSSILDNTSTILKAYNDFEAFSKRNTQTHTFLCNIFESYWEHKGQELHYVVRANRFLRGMVRALVGTQLLVARGKVSLEDFRKIIESRDCTLADFSVAGYGLYLEHIQYGDGLLEKIN